MREGEIILQDGGDDKLKLTAAANSKLKKDDGEVGVSNEVTEWTKAQYFKEVVLPYGASIDWDLSTQQAAKLTLTGDAVLNNPTNKQPGLNCQLLVIQDGSGGHTLTLGTDYELLSSAISTGGDSVAIYSFRVSNDKLYGAAIGN